MSLENCVVSEKVTSSSTLTLNPGAGLVACNAQDITRKGSKKSKHHILMVLPAQIAFKKSDVDYELGVLDHANTSEPTFVVTTERGILRYPGRYVSTSSAFFMIEILNKSQQSVVSEMYQQLLVFDAPEISPTIAHERNPIEIEVNSASSSVDMPAKEQATENIDTWCRHQGVSTIADRHSPLSGKTEIGYSPQSSTDEGGFPEDENNDDGRANRQSRRNIHTKISYADSEDNELEIDVYEESESPVIRGEKRNSRVKRLTKEKPAFEEDTSSDNIDANSDENTSDGDSATDESSDYEEPTKRRKRK